MSIGHDEMNAAIRRRGSQRAQMVTEAMPARVEDRPTYGQAVESFNAVIRRAAAPHVSVGDAFQTTPKQEETP